MIACPRPYQSGDLDYLLDLTRAAWRVYGPRTYYHVGDLCWRMRDLGYEGQLRVWEDDGSQIVGFSEFDGKDLEFQLHPAFQGHGLEEHVLAWAEENATTGAVKTWASGDDTGGMALLEARGYKRGEGWFNHHFRPLLEPVETPVLPPGFSVRSITPEEVGKRVDVHRTAWHPSPMNMERYHRLMATPFYRMDLDLVTVAPDGRFASCTNVWLDEESGVGLFEPVGTDPEFRKMGLGKAVVTEGLRRLRAVGARSGTVLSWSGNEASTRLYESCGLRTERRDVPYIKQGPASNLSESDRV
jgi:GNAT superfamily N-acetyltransferase